MWYKIRALLFIEKGWLIIYYIDIKNKRFLFRTIIRRNSRYFKVRVVDDHLVFSSPTRIKLKTIESFIEDHFDEIVAALAKHEKKDSIHYLGKEYNLIKRLDNINYVEIDDNNFIVHVTALDDRIIETVIYKFYGDYLINYMNHYFPIAKNDYNLNNDIKIVYKNVKTYFGKCYFKRNQVNFSLVLAKYEPTYIKCVLYHELAHFYEQNHSSKFYALCEQKLPGFTKYQKALRRFKYKDLYWFLVLN